MAKSFGEGSWVVAGQGGGLETVGEVGMEGLRVRIVGMLVDVTLVEVGAAAS